ncbi:uncharacterized protein EI97DRAFT_84197 [Westerdykella ornata]|uniref:Uncharacterized protein n=1 Tax=Westerdykella ornata TaxID=318751 RepID=A0A6A6JG90_WESOR|nr:uncharacterized protein EI97DRAFT_84197 [Westerdykella ornata]KAF2274998.1 hypothetical protein EI97DRAFT_84197 [Westerdykella ornata]
MKSAFFLAALVRLVASQGGHKEQGAEVTGHQGHGEPFEAPFKFYSRLSYYTPKDFFASVVVEGPGLEYVSHTSALAVITAEDSKDVVVPWGPLELQYRAPKFFNVTHAEYHFPLTKFPPQAEPYPLRLWATGDDGKPLCNLRTLLRVLPEREAKSLARQDRLEASILVHKPDVNGEEAQTSKPSVATPSPTPSPLHLNPDLETKPPAKQGADGYLPAGWWLKVLPATVHQTTWDHVQKSWENGNLTNWLEDIHMKGFNVIHPTNGSQPTSVPFNAELKYHVSKLAGLKDMFVLYEVDFISPGHNFRKFFLVDKFPEDYVHANSTFNETWWKRDHSKDAGQQESHNDGKAKAGFLPLIHKAPGGPPPFPLPTKCPIHAAAPSGARVSIGGAATAHDATVLGTGVTASSAHASETPSHTAPPNELDKEKIAWQAADTLRRLLDQVFSPHGTQQQPNAIKLKIACEGARTLNQIIDSYFTEKHQGAQPRERSIDHPHSEFPPGFPANRRPFHGPYFNSSFRNGSQFSGHYRGNSTDLENTDDESPSSSEGDVYEERSQDQDGDDWFQVWNSEDLYPHEDEKPHDDDEKPHGDDKNSTQVLTNEEKSEIMFNFQRTLYNMLHDGQDAQDLKTPTARGESGEQGDLLQAFERKVRSTLDSWVDLQQKRDGEPTQRSLEGLLRDLHDCVHHENCDVSEEDSLSDG